MNQPIMTRILIDFGVTVLEAELFDTPTARAIAAALPVSSRALTWGEEVYFEIPVSNRTRGGAYSVSNLECARKVSPTAARRSIARRRRRATSPSKRPGSFHQEGLPS